MHALVYPVPQVVVGGMKCIEANKLGNCSLEGERLTLKMEALIIADPA